MAWHSEDSPHERISQSNVAIISEVRENYFNMQIVWLQSPHTAKKGTASSSIVGRQNCKDSPLETKNRQVKMCAGKSLEFFFFPTPIQWSRLHTVKLVATVC